MAWTTANPVSIGAPTRKSQYDKLWDNVQYLKDVRDDSDDDSYVSFPNDDQRKLLIASTDDWCFTTTGVSLGYQLPAPDATVFSLSQYGMTLRTSRISAYDTADYPGGASFIEVDFDSEHFDTLSEYDTTPCEFTSSEAGYYLCICQNTLRGYEAVDGLKIASCIYRGLPHHEAYYTNVCSIGATGVTCSVSVMAVIYLSAASADWCGGVSHSAGMGVSLDFVGQDEWSFFQMHRLS